jgi:RecA-family ATPase
MENNPEKRRSFYENLQLLIEADNERIAREKAAQQPVAPPDPPLPTSPEPEEKTERQKEDEAYQKLMDRVAEHWSDEPHPLDKFKGDPEAFDIRTGSSWMAQARNKPKPRMLFSELWYENEICILFSDTNVGKSILATQIAESIASGKAIPGFKLETEKQKVIYFDFELSDVQFYQRYTDGKGFEYPFSPYMLRAELLHRECPDNYTDFDSYIVHSIERSVLKTGAKVLIVDNITYLRHDNERAKDATPFMQQLHDMKKRLGISILAIAHTPKRDKTQPLEIKDVAGSSTLTNFTDSIFGIGPSQKDPSLRYIKQLKMRACEHIYHARNVLVCRVEMQDNFLKFNFLDYGAEKDHLSESNDRERNEMIARVKQMSAEGKSIRQTADELGIGSSTVQRYLKQ